MDIFWTESDFAPSIEVLSASGQKVFSGNSIKGNQLKINTSSWSSGIYMVSISTPGEQASVKVVKL
ncbi:MAG: T9SS type A sorting domain-containing protein [Bacteroidetes bacterium]|nr:T9SS type A sorting domain-containing protein [Bacteroidota bacterium]